MCVPATFVRFGKLMTAFCRAACRTCEIRAYIREFADGYFVHRIEAFSYFELTRSAQRTSSYANNSCRAQRRNRSEYRGCLASGSARDALVSDDIFPRRRMPSFFGKVEAFPSISPSATLAAH